ncbi:MAG: DUF1566 domain-containing protein [Akkermansiaceae bacterium]|nr:DUF1566 domain-containing protein [Akkermansiaceae bacterium]
MTLRLPLVIAIAMPLSNAEPTTYPVVDTGQTSFFDGMKAISKPRAGSAFDGQDASFARNPPRYADNGDGTVTDEVTGLVWQKGFAVMTYQEALRKQKVFSLGGKTNDWRLPDIKELYCARPVQRRGCQRPGHGTRAERREARPRRRLRLRISARTDADDRHAPHLLHPVDDLSGKDDGRHEDGVRFQRGRRRINAGISGFRSADAFGKTLHRAFRPGRNPEYGKGDKLHDHGDGTIHDNATGLMWEKADSGRGMDWKNALAWVRGKNAEKYLGHDDWRLPNAKELHSIVDVTRGPQSTIVSARFRRCSRFPKSRTRPGGIAFPSFWTSTTHQNTRGGTDAVYICFGEALGWFRIIRRAATFAPLPARCSWCRSPALGPEGRAGASCGFRADAHPQGDVVRSKHHVRMVRDIRP